MVLIEQIEIKNFRSFGNRQGETTKLTKANPLNIISGSNDSGKSNILRGLNLFFNGNTDLNEFFDFNRDFFIKESPDEKDIKEELVTIKIWFSNKKNSGKNKKQSSKVYLPENFWVSKKWKKSSQYSQCDSRSNIETSFKHEKSVIDYSHFLDANNILKSPIKASLQKQLTEFLSQIQYHYVPAIKDKQYFSHLFGELQQTLWKAQSSQVDNKKNEFQQEIQNETSLLMKEFKDTITQKNLDYAPVFQLPENLVDLFRTLQVQTGDVELSQRGDGIQAKLIPEILNYISIKEKGYTSRTVRKDVQSKKYFVWGFEEPENSYEYRNAQLLANRFQEKFTENAQIFITTHSFNFISIEGNNVAKYRVWKDDQISSSRISRIDSDSNGKIVADDSHLKQSNRLNEELGVFLLNEKLEKVFLETEKIRIELENKIKKAESQTRCLFVEDEYDQIYKVAWLKLNDYEFNKDNIEEVFEQNSDFLILGLKGAGALAGLLRSKNPNVFENSKIVGLFDFDKEGCENFHHLKREQFWGNPVLGEKSTGYYRKRKDHDHWYGMLLPIPERLSLLADLNHDNFANYIEIENLLPQDYLLKNNYVETKKIVGTEYYKIKDKAKKSLWENTIELEKESFADFEGIFNSFESLLQDDA